jgi:hypothetical protein
VGTFINAGGCSNTLFHVLSQAYGFELKDEEMAAMPLAGGIMQYGYQCGMIWGATLAAGAQSYRLYGKGPKAEARAILASQKLVDSFRAQNRNTNCLEITEIDRTSSKMQMFTYFLIKGGTIGCFRMAVKYAPIAYNQINIALADDQAKTPCNPVSCAAMLAQKMGASDMHTVMAAGLAGGIGLDGGACGALGAAIWISGMNSLKKSGGKIDFKTPDGIAAIDRFLKCRDYEFECSKIVGRKFENIDDHASYLRDGGCSKIIDALAAK